MGVPYFKRLTPTLFLLAISCIEPYEPPISRDVLDILVVDGFLNASDGTASVKLSHTQAVSDSTATTPESGASVSIELPGGLSYFLTEQDSGRYTASGLTPDPNALCTLHIKTKSGMEYISDTIRVKATPPIDSLNFGVSGDGENLTVLVTTHDPLNKARYYTWDYTETYEYNAAFYSGFHLINKLLKFRKPEEQVYTCWRTVRSSAISIGTSASLETGVISRHTIAYLPRTSQKISVRYSILVKQMVISEAEYDYRQQLKNTTENLGSVFGNLPTTVTGNIHQVGNTQTTVLGYFSAAEVKEKRFFIERLQMPEYFRVRPSRDECFLEKACESDPTTCIAREIISPNSIVIYAMEEGYPPFFWFTTPACGDCRTQGGVTKRPEFW